jgi:hypothetical protein
VHAAAPVLLLYVPSLHRCGSVLPTGHAKPAGQMLPAQKAMST